MGEYRYPEGGTTGGQFMNKMVDLGTDTATLFVFHPEDLREHADDLIYWHTYDFVCHASLKSAT